MPSSTTLKSKVDVFALDWKPIEVQNYSGELIYYVMLWHNNILLSIFNIN